MSDNRLSRNEIILLSVFAGCSAVLLCFVPLCAFPVIECDCQHDGSEVDTPEEFETTNAGRKVRKVWFSQGTVAGVTQAQFQKRVMDGFRVASSVSSTDFVQSATESGAWLKVYAATDEMMWQKNPSYRKPKLVPLEMQNGNWMYFTVRNRWGSPQDMLIEAAAIHGLGHRVNLQHLNDTTSIMHPHLTSRTMNATDQVNFAKRLK